MNLGLSDDVNTSSDLDQQEEPFKPQEQSDWQFIKNLQCLFSGSLENGSEPSTSVKGSHKELTPQTIRQCIEKTETIWTRCSQEGCRGAHKGCRAFQGWDLQATWYIYIQMMRFSCRAVHVEKGIIEKVEKRGICGVVQSTPKRENPVQCRGSCPPWKMENLLFLHQLGRKLP